MQSLQVFLAEPTASPQGGTATATQAISAAAAAAAAAHVCGDAFLPFSSAARLTAVGATRRLVRLVAHLSAFHIFRVVHFERTGCV